MEEIIFQGEVAGCVAEQVIREREFAMTTRHFHESYEVYVLLDGSRYYFIENETYLVEAGMIVLVGRNQIHKTTMAGERSYHNRILLQLDAEVWDSWLKKCGMPPLEELFILCEHVVECEKEDFIKILQCLDSMKKEMKEKKECWDKAAQMKILEILITLYRSRKEEIWYSSRERQEREQERKGYEADTVRHKKVHEVAEYLQKYCETGENMDEISRRFFVSKSYLSRIFKEVTGFTVNEYQTMARMKRAKELLAGTELSVTEIAAMTGFGNITYFERVFKRYTDKKPLQYRKEYRSSKSIRWQVI